MINNIQSSVTAQNNPSFESKLKIKRGFPKAFKEYLDKNYAGSIPNSTLPFFSKGDKFDSTAYSAAVGRGENFFDSIARYKNEDGTFNVGKMLKDVKAEFEDWTTGEPTEYSLGISKNPQKGAFKAELAGPEGTFELNPTHLLKEPEYIMNKTNIVNIISDFDKSIESKTDRIEIARRHAQDFKPIGVYTAGLNVQA